MNLKSILILALTLLALPLRTTASGADADYHPLRLLVGFRHTATAATQYQALAAGVARVAPLLERPSQALAAGSPLDRVYVLTFVDEQSRAEAEATLINRPDIAFVERDYLAQLFADSLQSQQWALANTGQSYYGIERLPGFGNDTLLIKQGASGADINWPGNELEATGRHRVRLAIIDTGVDYLHPDLQDNIWNNAGEIPDNGRDDDFNGIADDYYGFDFSGDETNVFEFVGDSDPGDQVGHGTHVAGISAAVGGNGLGIAGVAPNVEVMCIKIFPNAFSSVIARAVIYAVDNGAEVINASWGTPYYSSIIEEAVRYADNSGVLFVAASGNSGTNAPFYPSSFDFILTVGASNSLDQVTSFSTFGDWVDMVAPGRDILSLRGAGTDLYEQAGEPEIRIIDDQYYLADGTSMAAPQVAGAACYLLSLAPGLELDSLEQLLLNTADDFIDPYGDGQSLPGRDIYAGEGRLNLGRAVQLLSGSYVEIEQPSFGSLQSGVIEFVGSAVSAQAGSFLLEARPASLGQWLTLAEGNAAVIRSLLAEWNSSAYDGVTDIRLSIAGELVYKSSLRLVNNQQVELLSPAPGDTIIAAAEIIGSASVPGFESYELLYYSDAAPATKNVIVSSTELIYRDLLADWKVGPIRPGPGMLKLVVHADGGDLVTESQVVITSSISYGYPVSAGVIPSLNATVGNVDGDFYPEIVIAGDSGIIINHYAEEFVQVVRPDFGTYYGSAVALHDLDSDGVDEIVCSADSGVLVLDGNGEVLPGWPQPVVTGNLYNGLPTPLVTDINGDGNMEIMILNQKGEIYCWRADGRSYFGTTGGLFASLSSSGRHRVFGGAYVPYLFAHDYNGDGYQDIGALYSVAGSAGGVFMFSGKNGQALFPQQGIMVRPEDNIFGGLLADFDNDGMPEIAYTHWFGGTDYLMAVTVCEADGSALPGWPKYFNDKTQWLSPYPAAADLDGDSLPELVCVFSAMDGAEVFAWHGDGSPLLESDLGRRDGFLAGVSTSLASPLILDVDDDGQPEIVSRGGALFWGKYERIFAWETDGSLSTGWPLYTYADPTSVTYSPFTPLAADFDLDGRIELLMSSSDRQIYSWDLPTAASADAIRWGSFLRDSRNTGVLPFKAGADSTSEPQPTLPQSFALRQNFPNPFNGSTVIEVELPAASRLQLDVYNVLGQKVASLADRTLPVGIYRFTWNGVNSSGDPLASGVYFYRMRTETTELTRKMLYLK